MTDHSNLYRILTIKGEICFDCGAPPNVRTFKVDISGNEELYLCTKCLETRFVYFSQTGKPLPQQVMCDGCKTDSHNEHHCEHTEVTVDGVKTKKPCVCEECAPDESSGERKFSGPHF